MVKIPVPGSKVDAKPRVSSGEGNVGAWNWLMHNCFRSQHTQNYQTNRIFTLLLWSLITLYKLYAVSVRLCSTREDMHYPWVISSVPISHILSTCEGMHYPWVISSVLVSHILSTREGTHYPWVISSVPVSHILSTVRICSTRESYPQYPWVISSVPVRVCCTCEDMQYQWGKFH